MLNANCAVRDDDRESLQIRKLLLETQGYSVLTADNGPEGLRLLAENPVDIIVLDYVMPDMDGLAGLGLNPRIA